MPGQLRAVTNWVGPVGTGAQLANALRSWSVLRFEVTEDLVRGQVVAGRHLDQLIREHARDSLEKRYFDCRPGLREGGRVVVALACLADVPLRDLHPSRDRVKPRLILQRQGPLHRPLRLVDPLEREQAPGPGGVRLGKLLVRGDRRFELGERPVVVIARPALCRRPRRRCDVAMDASRPRSRR